MVDKTQTVFNDMRSKLWFNEQFIDYTKLLGANLEDYKSLVNENEKNEKLCSEKHYQHIIAKKELIESKNIKELCRNGIPFKYFKSVILKMFNAQGDSKESFDLKYIKVFKGRDFTKLGDYCPYYTGFSTLAESLPYNFINSEGYTSVKQIQWMLNSVIPTIEFTPFLIRLNSLLHMFYQPYEVYFILRNLLNLNYNMKETSKIRWHLQFSQDDHNRLISSIIESFKDISEVSGKACLEHLEEIGFDPNQLIEDIAYNLFMGYFKFEGVYRLLGFYLREGVKAIYRTVFALLKTLNPIIMQIKMPEEVLSNVRKAALEINDFPKLFELAFGFNLTRNNNKYDFQEKEMLDEYLSKRNTYYLPKYVIFEKAIRVLTEESLIKLWSKLPLELKIRDCHMIFSSSVDGFNLKSIYHAGTKLIQKNMNSPNDYISLFLIETQSKEVFGGLMSKLVFPTGNEADCPERCMLIKFEPNFEMFEPMPNSKELVFMDNSTFLFGIGDSGSSIRINSELSHGFSHFSSTFNSPILTKKSSGEYFIKQVEVYVLL